MPYFVVSATLIIPYAATVMTILLDVHPLALPTAKKYFFFLSIALVTLLSCWLLCTVDVHLVGKYYPVLAQLPTFLIFCVVFKRGIAKVFFVLLTAIFLSFPYNVLNMLVGKVWSNWGLRVMATLCIIAILLLFIRHSMQSDFSYAMEYLTSVDILKFCLIPFFYNILNYSVSHYTTISPILLLRVLIFLSALSSYSLTIGVFRRTRELQRLQNEHAQLSIRTEAANEQLSLLQLSQEQALVYRHDMRHHFALINDYLCNEDITDAINYIKSAQSDIDSITPTRYCHNTTVNLILSSFIAKATKVQVTLQINADLDNELPLSETELCTILSNALENAIAATAKTDLEEKIVSIRCHIHKHNLLIFMENPYTGNLVMEQGLPQNKQKNHGFGTKSISMIVKKHHGYCSFTTKDNIFTLKILLPFDAPVRTGQSS